jgi:hypothetical protein
MEEGEGEEEGKDDNNDKEEETEGDKYVIDKIDKILMTMYKCDDRMFSIMNNHLLKQTRMFGREEKEENNNVFSEEISNDKNDEDKKLIKYFSNGDSKFCKEGNEIIT